jgi:hypothetical protein
VVTPHQPVRGLHLPAKPVQPAHHQTNRTNLSNTWGAIMTAFTDALSGLQITGPDLDEGEIIADAIIITRVMRADADHSGMNIHATSGTDAIVELGMLTAAQAIAKANCLDDDE